MRKQHNVKSIGFTYAKTDILSALNSVTVRALPPVQHITLAYGVHEATPEMVDWARSINPLAVPVFHRSRRQVEMPTPFGAGKDWLMS
jgi:hypothetical protein